MQRLPLSIFLAALSGAAVILAAGMMPETPGALAEAPQATDGSALFESRCASCHIGAIEDGVPDREALGSFSPNFIVSALAEGTMTLQAEGMSAAERVLVAEFLTGEAVVDRPVTITEGLCETQAPMANPASRPLWNGWGPTVANTRFQADPGLNAEQVPDLGLAWVFGLPGETQARAQPAIVGDRLFTGSQAGGVYALDPVTGCTYWTFLPQAGVRSAFSVGPIERPDGTAGHAVHFVDLQANVYGVDAESGRQIWSRKVEEHPAVRGTGSVTLHDGRLYVPMTGVSEENAASNPDYECCRFRGSVTALDAGTGEVLWKTYTVPPSERRGTSTSGVPLWGPAGVGIWSAPTVDAERGLLYVATGNAYADPPQPTADAVIALDMDTGEIAWINQLTPGDTWIGGCGANSADNPNCPENVGPDFDFSASPVLAETPGGRDLLIVPQKSGMGYALDPEDEGALVWEYRWGPGSAVGGVWGTAVAGDRAYFAVGGYSFGRGGQTGGIHAVEIETGRQLWYTPPQELLCGGGRGCSSTQSAAVTAIPGVVFSGSADGGLRAYSAEDGSILWTFDANREFETVNGVAANGGSFDGAGVVVAGGMVYVLSGNAGFVGSPGNALLAFRPE